MDNKIKTGKNKSVKRAAAIGASILALAGAGLGGMALYRNYKNKEGGFR